ncbi:unnamed protein product [Cuscuta campestris]|uniref:RRM domain-containing protein n=1 Tax=Cuscuta campestris TaxID=132261 RepID=A0A484MZ35_9ASTE|nr:unnamed protein product [Cuscuta campestris]
MAYIEFARSDAVNKALKLNDSKLGSNTLQVEEAKPRGTVVVEEVADVVAEVAAVAEGNCCSPTLSPTGRKKAKH